MDLVNKRVTHTRFGEGRVIAHNDSYVEIHFALGEKKFVFPDAFGKFLTLKNQRVADSIRRMIQKKELELNKAKELQSEKRRRQMERVKQLRRLEQEKIVNNRKTHPSSQAVFWCKAEDQDRVFAEWSVCTGVIKSGNKKGQPNRLIRMKKNSACLLTAREPDMPEENRSILGAYMVKGTFTSKLCKDGYIPAHSEYRLRLSEQESEKMLFWKYYVNERYPHKMTWNTGAYRYFDNIWMAQILRDIVSLKKKPQEQERVQRFFEYFCQMNQIKEEELPMPNGALMRL